MAGIDTGWDQVHVIGVDDGGPDSLTPAERRLVDAADLLCGGERHLRLFPSRTAERFCIRDNLSELYLLLEEAAGRRRVVVLASGDPCFFGVGPLIAQHLGGERVAIHPRPTAAALAFARLGLAWQDATVLSVHGRPLAEAVPTAIAARKLAIYTDPRHTPAVVARALLEAGMEDCPAYVCERLGGLHEHIVTTRLVDLPGQAFDPLNIVILLPGRKPVQRPAFGRSDDAYSSLRGQITKAEVRAVTISRLEPWRARVAWDIGAGSGSISIEMAGLMDVGRVFAVERDEEQLQVLQANLRRYRAPRVQVVTGAAPASLESLPDPDTVFVGGGASALAEILRVAAERLKPGGRLVANFARLESLAIWQQFASDHNWPAEIVQLSVSRGVTLAKGTRLSALGPVFVTRLQRPRRALPPTGR
jgi:precorrin-6B C5,15-methyltransferase / cobalt-precorrin-6B C5,C15-methyltransferase